ncbi:MAG: class I tRNA ligase family protein [Candidatus Pacearchaeota archaeon]|jgi:leucyl-tRNA synthetase family protein
MVIYHELNFQKIEQKWQKKWEEKKIFEVNENFKKPKFYNLEMFPYPSASGLHIGHALNYTIGDIYARFKRMQGFNVLYPMGYDALGLPAENAAIKDKTHPEDYTKKSTTNFMKQQKMLGLSYDWSRLINTSDSDYYKWDQWIFLKMLEKGIAYKKSASVNWCPSCKTVLANEQAQGGICERCKTTLEIKNLAQWFFKITNYAEELFDKIDSLDWPARTKAMQKNWIGKSYGTEIDFEISKENKISNVIVVHGGDLGEKDNSYFKHWMPWLKKKLNENKIHSEFPLMPVDVKTTYNDWKKIFDKFEINDESILIGHSRGTAFLVKWLGETKKKVKKLILVAPWKFADKKHKETFYDFKIDNEIKNRINEIIIFTSNDEEKDGKNSVKIFYDSLGGKKIELKNHGHFTLEDMKTEEFPELLNEIIKNQKWPIFTTRPDTIFGVTFLVISAQHPRLFEIVTKEQKKEVENFLKKLKSVSEKELHRIEVSGTEFLDSSSEDRERKEGVFTGSYAINPINNEKVPVYAGNFVVADYGCGMVMAVPAHDQRDFEFAKKYNLKINPVIIPRQDYIDSSIFKYSKFIPKYSNKHFRLPFITNEEEREAWDFLNDLTKKIKKGEICYTDEEGILINSDKFNNIFQDPAIVEIPLFLQKKGLAKHNVCQYKLRDWLISRQRYWGTPIPIVYCDKCGIVPVLEKDLPVKLPKEVKFGKGNPLETNEKWINTKCPKCKGKARRETDTMDTFVNSSWYFLRYCDFNNSKKIFDEKKVKYWMPIDLYIGGAEHACMHLIYCRFYTKFLRDLGLLNFDEPAKKLFHQGMLHGEDGEKMSKSSGNTVDPIDVIKKYSADSLRLALMSFASPDSDTNWDENVLIGNYKFLNKVYSKFENIKFEKSDAKTESKLNQTIKKVSENIENLKYNLAIISLRSFFEGLPEKTSKDVIEKFLKLLSPFCPHVSEELWEKIGNKGFVSLEKWPEVDEKKINENFNKAEEMIEKLSNDINNVIKILDKKSNKVFVYCLPNELNLYKEELNLIKKKTNLNVEIYAVNDVKKHDPENKSKKAKPGKPAIYLE